jgi:hypothetical protein
LAEDAAAQPRKDATMTPMLKWALLGDAAASAATGLLLAAAAGPLAASFGLPAGLLQAAGLILLPYAGFVLWAGTRAEAPRLAVRAIIALNLLWVLDSAMLLLFQPASPLGVAFVVAQALVVLGFALLQRRALREASGVSAHA